MKTDEEEVLAEIGRYKRKTKWSAGSQSIVVRCLRQKKQYIRRVHVHCARFLDVVQLALNPLSYHRAGSREERKVKKVL